MFAICQPVGRFQPDGRSPDHSRDWEYYLTRSRFQAGRLKDYSDLWNRSFLSGLGCASAISLLAEGKAFRSSPGHTWASWSAPILLLLC
jgi:hypothetical protein